MFAYLEDILGRVLLPRRFLDGVADGSIDLAFRRWKRPTVRAGGRLRTRIGELAIGDVRPVARAAITAAEAVRAGYSSRAELLRVLDRRSDGRIYRVELRLAGPDPRMALRERADIDAEELDGIRVRLDRYDAASRHGPWTRDVLQLIAERPATLAAELAATRNMERLAFKRDVRKLKELGLTESLERGYRLSPRGAAVLLALPG